MGGIEEELRSHASLEDLKLTIPPYQRNESTESLMASLHRLLERTNALQGLTFCNFVFDKDDLKALFVALMSNETAAFSLRFKGSTFEAEATELLVSHIQDEYDKYMLELEDCSFRGSTQGGGAVCARCLVGSTLQALSLTCRHDDDGSDVLYALPNNSAIRLASLNLNSTSRDSMAAVVQTIPNVLYLQDLSICRRGSTRTCSSAVLLAVRDNGSLHQFTVQDDPSFFTAQELRHAKAFGKRNHHVPRLLTTGASVEILALVPSLVAAALPAKRMAPNIVLKGLVRADFITENLDDESNVPSRQDLKRKRCAEN